MLRNEMTHDSGRPPPLLLAECHAVIAEQLGCKRTVPLSIARCMLGLSKVNDAIERYNVHVLRFAHAESVTPMLSHCILRFPELMSCLRARRVATETSSLWASSPSRAPVPLPKKAEIVLLLDGTFYQQTIPIWAFGCQAD